MRLNDNNSLRILINNTAVANGTNLVSASMSTVTMLALQRMWDQHPKASSFKNIENLFELQSVSTFYNLASDDKNFDSVKTTRKNTEKRLHERPASSQKHCVGSHGQCQIKKWAKYKDLEHLLSETTEMYRLWHIIVQNSDTTIQIFEEEWCNISRAASEALCRGLNERELEHQAKIRQIEESALGLR